MHFWKRNRADDSRHRQLYLAARQPLAQGWRAKIDHPEILSRCRWLDPAPRRRLGHRLAVADGFTGIRRRSAEKLFALRRSAQGKIHQMERAGFALSR